MHLMSLGGLDLTFVLMQILHCYLNESDIILWSLLALWMRRINSVTMPFDSCSLKSLCDPKVSHSLTRGLNLQILDLWYSRCTLPAYSWKQPFHSICTTHTLGPTAVKRFRAEKKIPKRISESSSLFSYSKHLNLYCFCFTPKDSSFKQFTLARKDFLSPQYFFSLSPLLKREEILTSNDEDS